MISFAPGFISRRFFTAAGLDTPSQIVALSRRRFANEYSDGSLFRRYAADIWSTSGFNARHSTSTDALLFVPAAMGTQHDPTMIRYWFGWVTDSQGDWGSTVKTGTSRTGSSAENISVD